MSNERKQELTPLGTATRLAAELAESYDYSGTYEHKVNGREITVTVELAPVDKYADRMKESIKYWLSKQGEV